MHDWRPGRAWDEVPSGKDQAGIFRNADLVGSEQETGPKLAVYPKRYAPPVFNNKVAICSKRAE